MKLKTIKPSSSYQVRLPVQINEDSNGTVSSYWLGDSPLLLQLSSYLRADGEQVSAHERLSQRKMKHQEKWSNASRELHPDRNIDQATGQFTDSDGIVWVHTYLVWPHLAVYALVSGPGELVAAPDNWAIEAVKSIELTRH